MNTPIVEGEQLEINFNLDRPKFSICPNCAAQVIKLVDGCSVCGWCEDEKLLGGSNKCSSNYSSTFKNQLAIPCTISQPNQPIIKGVIQQDRGDCFIIYIPSQDNTVNISKLLVYPDFANVSDKLLQGGSSNCSSNCSSTSDNCSSNNNPPSTKTNKQRRQKGEGSGHIYYRTVTRNGKEYRQAYYQWREKDGKQRTKYIPKKLLHEIEEAEQQKYPVTKILEKLQGGLNICSSKSSSTLSDDNVLAKNESPEGYRSAYDKTINKCSSKNDSPPCKRRKRSSGYGGGYIEYREVKRNHKVYDQYWYHYEFWDKGNVVTKKSKYIPKNKRSRVKKMNDEKAPVNKILQVLRDRSKRK